jgi:hypothetical protein
VEHSERESSKKRDFLLFQTFAGSGKSTTIMQTVDSYGYQWIYLAPYHDVITDIFEYSKIRDYRNWSHLKGKEQLGVCSSELMIEYLRKGIDITPFCMVKCTNKKECVYYKTKEEIEDPKGTLLRNWAGVHSHIPTYLQHFLFDIEYKGKKMMSHYEVLIIDEFPLGSLFDSIRVTQKDIIYLFKLVSKYSKDSEEKG